MESWVLALAEILLALGNAPSHSALVSSCVKHRGWVGHDNLVGKWQSPAKLAWRRKHCSRWCKWQVKGSLASCMDWLGVPTCDQVSLHLCVCFPLTAYPFRRPNRERATLSLSIPMAEVLGVSPIYLLVTPFSEPITVSRGNILIGQAWVMCLLIGQQWAMETCPFKSKWREEVLSRPRLGSPTACTHHC